MSPGCLPAGECPQELGDVGQSQCRYHGRCQTTRLPGCSRRLLCGVHIAFDSESHPDVTQTRSSCELPPQAFGHDQTARPFVSSANRTDAAAYRHSTEESLTGLKHH